MNKFFTNLLVFLLIILFIWFFYESLLFFNDADKEIKAAFIGVSGLTIVAFFTHYFAQKREIASRHFAQKVKAYEKFFDFVFDLTKNSKNNDEMREEDMFERAFTLKKDLMIWAGSDVIKAWRDFEMESTKGTEANHFKYIDKLFRALRKELGHRDTSLAEGDFVKWMVISSEHSIIDKKIKES